MDQQIAIIRSLVHAPVLSGLIVGEDGFYELEVNIDMTEAKASGDPQGFVNHQVARHLASCTQRTTVPMGEGLWYVQFSPWAQTHLNMPKEFFV